MAVTGGHASTRRRTAAIIVVRPSTRISALARSPAWWLVLTLLVAGAARMTQLAGRFFVAYPIATGAALLLFGLLAVPFWLFVSELDFIEREPIELRAVAFAWGALVATSVSITASAALEKLAVRVGSPHLTAQWAAALVGPTVEEAAKTLGVITVVLVARAHINSVLDGVVYGALVGLGFQIAEDIVFAVGAVASAGHGDQVQPVATTFLLRGFLAAVWSHALFGALAGAGIGYLVVRRDRGPARRVAGAMLAGLGAWAAHVLWNAPIFGDGLGAGVPGLLVGMLVKGMPPLLLILLLVRHLHDCEVSYYVAHLATVGDPEQITDGELAVLGNGAGRAAARRYAAARAGRSGHRAVRGLQRAQARLAVELSRASTDLPDESSPPTDSSARDSPACGAPAPGSPARESPACAEIRGQRADLRRLGHPDAAAGPRSWRSTASTIGTAALALAVLWAALAALGAA